MNKFFQCFAFSVCAVAAMFAARCAVAHDGHAAHGASQTAAVVPSTRAVWRFTLATLEGDRFVRSSDFNGPVLVNFWSRDCPPCIAELPRLQAFANSNKDWAVLLVATDSAHDAQAFLSSRSITLTSLRAGTDTRALLRVAGNPSGALPFSRAQLASNTCFTKLGELSEWDFGKIHASCALDAER